MRILTSLTEAAALLASGGVVLLPTDTVPGLHCRADLTAAVDRVARLKQRASQQPFLLLWASLSQALHFTIDVPERTIDYMNVCWPGPFTLILKAGRQAPRAATAGGNTIAGRVPALPALAQLVASVGSPLVSTSANLAGQPPSFNLDEARSLWGEEVDGVIPETLLSPPSFAGRASALLDLTDWPPRLLREGILPPPSWRNDG